MTVATRKKRKLDKQTGKTIKKNMIKEELCASLVAGMETPPENLEQKSMATLDQLAD
jgi:hypothetical protein